MNCQFCRTEKNTKNSLSQHEIRCKLNPTRIKPSMLGKTHSEKTKRSISRNNGSKTNPRKLSETEKQSISFRRKGSKQSQEIKSKISTGMILAHAENRAWNIGQSRWNNKPSWPEEFFAKVIENEFLDKEYISEFPIGRFSIDFAWVQKKLAIEIDGEQHEKFEYKQRDKRKEICLLANGWKLLRIKWKDMYNDPQFWIKIAKVFIGE